MRPYWIAKLSMVALALGLAVTPYRVFEERLWRGEIAYMRWRALQRTRPGR